MDAQIAMLGFEPPEHNEVQYLDSILPRLQKAVTEHGGESQHLTFSPTSSYTVVSFLKLTCFRLKLRGKQHYISVPLVFKDLIPAGFHSIRPQSEPKYIRISMGEDDNVDAFTDFLARIAGETVNRYPKGWDCCSRYLECSDAKTCVHPDKTFALECGYRRVLSSGRIFYGRNRNVD